MTRITLNLGMHALCLAMILFYTIHCQTKAFFPYPRMIGDISYDASIDDPEFNLCRDDSLAIQYYALTKLTGEKPYIDEKYAVHKTFKEKYNPHIAKSESGLIRVRFIVNCNGKAGRLRVLGMDNDYREKQFDISITNQLHTIIKHHLKWNTFKTLALQRDYYMYLIFKIEEGKIIEILP